ncbi:spop-a [Symbiodinium sp. KB8]|nr:spop-a [Symbiodinium sp. KB8]
MAATAEPEEWVRGEHSEDEDDGVQQVPLESEPHVTNHAKTVAVFKRLMADDKFADLVLVVGPTKQRMAAHKFVLMTRSTVLRSMLSGEWRETKDSPEVWKELLAHAYTSKWSNAPSLLLDVKDYADRYGFGDLADDCGERISAMLSGEPENVMTMAAKAVAMAVSPDGKRLLSELRCPGPPTSAFSRLVVQAGHHRNNVLPVASAAVPAAARALQNPVIRDLAFSSAFLNTATALRSEGILRLDRDALLTFVSDPRCATDEVDVFRAVVRWGLNQMAIAHAEGKGPSPIGRSKEDLEAAYSFLSHDIPGRAEAQEKCVGGGELEFEPAARGSSLAREARRRGKAFIPPHEMHSADVPDDASFLSLTDAQMAGLGPKLRAMRLRAKDTLQHSVVQTAEPADLREVLGEVLDAVRFPLIDAAGLAADVGPSGLLAPEQLVELYCHQMVPFSEAWARKTVAGFSNEPRAPVAKLLTISLWGAGGASGKHSGGAAGGAGGYIRVHYKLLPDDRLSVYVGEGGLADNSDSVMTSAAWPNGGKGGYNYKTGSGGGSSLVTSELHDGKVLVGAGGGGGGTAAHSWSSGGGGGGGCKDGKMGQGGHGQMRTAEALRIGSDGGGNGGKDDSNGSGSAGESSHGAGGLSGSSTNANGGDGGEAFVLESAGVVLLSKINATSAGAVACDESGKSAGGGGGPGDCKRGSHGLVIIENSASGKRLKFEFSEKEPAVVCFGDL